MTKYFVSEIDGFLTDLDRRFPQKSASQQAVIKKYARIIKLRNKTASSRELANKKT